MPGARAATHENGYNESFNGKLRDELLNGEIFCSLAQATVLVKQWRREYNTVRPHSACGGFPPAPEAIKPSASRITPPPLAEESDPAEKDTRRGSPLSGVQKGHCWRIRIHKINRHTVRDRDRQENTRVGGGVAVRPSLRLSDALTDPVMNDDPGLVDLAGIHDGLEFGSLEQIVPPCGGPLRRRTAKQPEIEWVGARSGVGDRGEQPRKPIGPIRDHVKRNAVLSGLLSHANQAIAPVIAHPRHGNRP